MSIQQFIDKHVNNSFVPHLAVRYIIAMQFHRDGNLFISKFDACTRSEDIDSTFFRAKLFVDLLNSIECSMKSLYFSLSDKEELPHILYKRMMKKYSKHDLVKLEGRIRRMAKNRFSLSDINGDLIAQLNDLGISSRYEHDYWVIRMFSGDTPFDSPTHHTVDDYKWAKDIRKQAVICNHYAHRALKRYLGSQSSTFGPQHRLKSKALKEFMDKIHPDINHRL